MTSIPRPAAALLAAALLLGACGQARDGEGPAGDATPAVAADPAFEAGEAGWREERRERLLEEDGWASLVGLHWLELRAHYIGSSPTSGIRLAMGPPKLGLVQQDSERVTFTPEPGVEATLGDAPVAGRVVLLEGRGAEAAELRFDEGRGRLTVIERGGRRALRVKHADAPARVRFGEIPYWPADPGWSVEARFVPHPAGRTLEIASIIGGTEPVPNPGALEFTRDGGSYRLEALEGEDGGFFVIFADRTSGHDSYGAGRYLDTAAPDAQGRVTLNFNRAYNPPCAFTDFATCPLPPPENRLDLAVTAGEQAYPRPGT